LVDLARQTSSDATLHLGDDVTDERALAALDPAQPQQSRTEPSPGRQRTHPVALSYSPEPDGIASVMPARKTALSQAA